MWRWSVHQKGRQLLAMGWTAEEIAAEYGEGLLFPAPEKLTCQRRCEEDRAKQAKKEAQEKKRTCATPDCSKPPRSKKPGALCDTCYRRAHRKRKKEQAHAAEGTVVALPKPLPAKTLEVAA